MKTNSDKLITIKTFNNPLDANIAKGLLEANNIDAVLFDENTINANPFYSIAIGGVKLVVRESDYEAASKLLNEVHNDQED